MEKIKGLYHQYSHQVMDWYNGLEQLYQYGVIFLLIVVGLLVLAHTILSRVTR